MFIPDGTLLVFSVKHNELTSLSSLNSPLGIETLQQRPVKEKSKDRLEQQPFSELSLNTSSISSTISSPISSFKRDFLIHEQQDIATTSPPTEHEDATQQESQKDDEEVFKIDELQLRAGMEKTIEVFYQPERDSLDSTCRAGRLSKKSFKFMISFSRQGSRDVEKKTIQCRARSCTSFIDVYPKLLNFGDTDVKVIKTLPIYVKNLSDLPTRVELRFISKILSASREEIYVPANETVEAKLDLFPLKVNPDYRKQVTIVNLLNRDNDQTIEVRSSNIDQQKVFLVC